MPQLRLSLQNEEGDEREFTPREVEVITPEGFRHARWVGSEPKR